MDKKTITVYEARCKKCGIPYHSETNPKPKCPICGEKNWTDKHELTFEFMKIDK